MFSPTIVIKGKGIAFLRLLDLYLLTDRRESKDEITSFSIIITPWISKLSYDFCLFRYSCLFQFEQAPLCGKTSPVTDQSTVASNNPVAGNDDGKSVRPICSSDRPYRFFILNGSSNVKV
jgi:hypothetical protein